MNQILARAAVVCEWALRQPLTWGFVACLALFAAASEYAAPGGALDRCLLVNPWPWKALAGTLFCTGLAQLGLKGAELLSQAGGVATPILPSRQEGRPLDQAIAAVLEALRTAPASWQAGYLGVRLRRAIEWVALRRSPDGLDHTLRELSANDRAAAHQSYNSNLGLAIGAVVAGLLATITEASHALHPSADSVGPTPQLMTSMAAAMDPAAGALAMALVLVGVRWLVSRWETGLLDLVEAEAERQLLGRFGVDSSGGDPHIAAVARTSEKVLHTVSAAASQHDAALLRALATANRRWEEMAAAAVDHLQQAVTTSLTAGLERHAQLLNDGVRKHAEDLEGVLVRHAEILNDGVDRHATALADSLEHHAAVLTAAEEKLALENRRHLTEVETAWGQSMLVAAASQDKFTRQCDEVLRELQVALVDSAGTTVAHQEQLVKQSELLLRVIESTGQIRGLEAALHDNLAALAAANSFSETADSLAAAVQLLSARLRHPALDRAA